MAADPLPNIRRAVMTAPRAAGVWLPVDLLAAGVLPPHTRFSPEGSASAAPATAACLKKRQRLND